MLKCSENFFNLSQKFRLNMANVNNFAIFRMRTLIASLPKRFKCFVVAQLIVIAIVSVSFVIFGLIFTLTYGLINGFTEPFTDAYNFLKSLWNHPETLPMLLPLYIGMSLIFFGLLGP